MGVLFVCCLFVLSFLPLQLKGRRPQAGWVPEFAEPAPQLIHTRTRPIWEHLCIQDSGFPWWGPDAEGPRDSTPNKEWGFQLTTVLRSKRAYRTAGLFPMSISFTKGRVPCSLIHCCRGSPQPRVHALSEVASRSPWRVHRGALSSPSETHPFSSLPITVTV